MIRGDTSSRPHHNNNSLLESALPENVANLLIEIIEDNKQLVNKKEVSKNSS